MEKAVSKILQPLKDASYVYAHAHVQHLGSSSFQVP